MTLIRTAVVNPSSLQGLGWWQDWEAKVGRKAKTSADSAPEELSGNVQSIVPGFRGQGNSHESQLSPEGTAGKMRRAPSSIRHHQV